MPMDIANVLIRAPSRRTTLAMMMHHLRPSLVDRTSPIKGVKMEGIKNEAA
jgi:hypothetical protein